MTARTYEIRPIAILLTESGAEIARHPCRPIELTDDGPPEAGTFDCELEIEFGGRQVKVPATLPADTADGATLESEIRLTVEPSSFVEREVRRDERGVILSTLERQYPRP